MSRFDEFWALREAARDAAKVYAEDPSWLPYSESMLRLTDAVREHEHEWEHAVVLERALSGAPGNPQVLRCLECGDIQELPPARRSRLRPLRRLVRAIRWWAEGSDEWWWAERSDGEWT